MQDTGTKPMEYQPRLLLPEAVWLPHGTKVRRLLVHQQSGVTVAVETTKKGSKCLAVYRAGMVVLRTSYPGGLHARQSHPPRR